MESRSLSWVPSLPLGASISLSVWRATHLGEAGGGPPAKHDLSWRLSD